ncbi:MAG TPA: glycosyltransferase [Gemmatimonadaceae bacterium]|jgi:glycosyltransferase involved in cell wall biosynthesis|nr:glycosyltransferase [Gemmatimonadaceae bacterium]
MNILHVVAPSPVGGLERVVQTLAIAQRANGDEVRVAAVFAENSSEHSLRFIAPLQAANVAVDVIEVPPRGYRREAKEVAELCRRHRVDVVHTHGYRCDIVNARTDHAAHVATAHGFTGGGVVNRVYEWLQRLVFRRFDAVIAVARPLAYRLARAGVPSNRIHVVTNAWSESVERADRAAARAELGVPADAFMIGWVGRVSHEKGLDVLLAALPRLGKIPWHLHVFGDGRERASLERWTRRQNLDGRIVWHGLVPAAERWFAAFDAFVLSSRTEGTPIVLFEAAGAGVPIVATNVGGVPDVTSENEVLLVPSDRPDELAAALRDVYRNPRAAARRARAAQSRVRREFGIEGWYARHREVYEAALATAAGRR